MELVHGALTCRHIRPRFAYIGPQYNQTKRNVWDYVKAYCQPIPGVHFNESELRADFPNGGRLTLYGADNPDSLRGAYLDGVVFDEYADMPPSLWTSVARPMLSDRRGWAIFIGTPKGRNAFYDVYQSALDRDDWFTVVFKASETGIVPKEELESAAEDMDDSEYEQEFECSFQAAIRGAYYGKEIAKLESDNRITSVPYDPSLPVFTAWDLGVGDSTAIWFCQRSGPEWRAIDYLEASGVGLDHYVREINARPYVYGEHIWPHDGKNREFATGLERTQVAANMGLHVRVLDQHQLMDGIDATRRALPMFWMDADKCRRGIDALSLYRRDWDEKRQDFKTNPLHDWTSHGADAMRYMIMGDPRSASQRSDWSKPIQPKVGTIA